MKKFIFMFALMVSALMSANAQIATQNSNALDNISVGVTAGVSTPLDFNSIFPINPMVGLKIQKDFSPVVGLQAEGIAILNDNHFSDIKTTVKATNVGLNGVINITNAFWGYKGSPRFFEVSTVTGIGWLHTWTTKVNNLTAKTGLDLAFNLGKNKAHSIVITPAVYWNLNKFNQIEFNKNGSQLSLMASYVYHFKTSNGTHSFKTYDIGAMNTEINSLRSKLDECESRKPTVVEKVVEKVVVKEAPTTAAVVAVKDNWNVSFEKGKANLSNDAKKALDTIGENTVVNVEGQASPEGADWFNKKLAKTRGNVVKKYLTNRGVRVDKVTSKTMAEKAAIVTVAQ